MKLFQNTLFLNKVAALQITSVSLTDSRLIYGFFCFNSDAFIFFYFVHVKRVINSRCYSLIWIQNIVLKDVHREIDVISVNFWINGGRKKDERIISSLSFFLK